MEQTSPFFELTPKELHCLSIRIKLRKQYLKFVMISSFSGLFVSVFIETGSYSQIFYVLLHPLIIIKV